MHISSQVKFEAFLETYLSKGEVKGKSILDIGSRSVQGATKAYNYRQSTDAYGFSYTGIDFEEGPNVDLVPKNPYVWEEIASESFDFVVSGQAFEHNPFPWITFCEIARVLKVGGIAFVIAPSAGPVHRWPYDCWRYYPDSWAGLCCLAGLEATEVIREDAATSTQIPGGGWMDSAVIATKRPFGAPEKRVAFYRNLAQNVAPFKNRRYEVTPASINAGPAYRSYLLKMKQHKIQPKKGAAAPARPGAKAAAKLAAVAPAKKGVAAPVAAKQPSAKTPDARALRRKRARRLQG